MKHINTKGKMRNNGHLYMDKTDYKIKRTLQKEMMER